MKKRFIILTSISASLCIVAIYLARYPDPIVEKEHNMTNTSPALSARQNPSTIKQSCQSCHLTEGDNYAAENGILSGQGEAYLFKQLTDFKAGKRSISHLPASIHKLSLSDMTRYAKSYSVKNKINLIGNTSALGELLYNKGDDNRQIPACMSCHVKGGQGIASAAIPALTGQSYAYIIKQLKSFKSGKRDNDKNQLMQNIAVRLNNGDITALASHIVSLNATKN